ncbi:MAG: hypothetical protein B7733_20295 [Myxococcales bacterium FL481]|nr:MAG: hypothetical protein B7733_20295 [Myxococcales bacterium FL481]
MPQRSYLYLAWAFAPGLASCGETEPPDLPNPSSSSGADPSPDPEWSLGDAPIIAPQVQVHPQVATVLEVTWTQTTASERTWLEYSFEDDEWHLSPARAGHVGPHREAVLGVPADTQVQIRIVMETAGVYRRTGDATAATGSLPRGMPRPRVVEYFPGLASHERYLLGSVDGMEPYGHPYDGPFWLYVVDRRGRVVWYYSDLGSGATMAFPRVAPAGTHVVVEKRMFGAGQYAPRLLEIALDGSYSREIPVPGLDDSFDLTDWGTVLFNTWSRDGEAALREQGPDGTSRIIWDCRRWAGPLGILHQSHCYSNTVAWNRADDTVTMSMPYINTAVEVDRVSGELVGQYGDAPYSYGFDPDSWSFEFNHYVNITPDGTLLVSSHMPGHGPTEIPGDHAFVEFTIDRDQERLVERWAYHGRPEWAMYKGMAMRLANGNTLANYGTGGVIREITPDKRTAWEIVWDVEHDKPHVKRMVGHNVLVDDLYALSQGPVQ